MSCHGIRLFLLYPVSGPFDQMTATQVSTGVVLHFFEVAWFLENTPVLSAGDKAAGYVDGLTGKHTEITGIVAASYTAIPLQSALEPGRFVGPAVVRQFVFCQPPA